MEAFLYKTLPDQKVQCHLCRHHCVIQNRLRGRCGVRENNNGKLVSLVYGRLIAANTDPVEKKPLYHFMPGTLTYSVGTSGCNFKCDFCQNHTISRMPADNQGRIEGTATTPKQVVDAALKNHCASIAFTYNEPTVFFEFAIDTAKIARNHNLKTIFVSNGYMSRAAIDLGASYMDAVNIDLKSFSADFYQRLCGADITHVKDTIKRLKAAGVFVEITTLIIHGENDSRQELKSLAGFIADEIGPETPWHVSRFHPAYKMTGKQSTPVETIRAAREIGLESGLKYVYTGNVPGEDGENTYCPKCHAAVIKRLGYQTKNFAVNGRCSACDTSISGVDI